MKIIVPRFRQDLPYPNRAFLDVMFAEITASDLPLVMEEWKRQKEIITQPDIKVSLAQSIKHVCQGPIHKHVLAPYLLRPHMTVHCGASEGNRHVRDIAKKAIRETVRLGKRYGFTIWYGGGDTGLMGEIAAEYTDTPTKHEGQYLVQISPADFVKGVESRNGLRPVNEGLSQKSDLAFVMPEFVTRRHMLDIMLDKEDVAVTGPGDRGSIDEWSDVAVHIKTGLIDTNLYMLNIKFPVLVGGFRVPFFRKGFWDPMREQLENSVSYGFGKKQSLEKMLFMSTPDQIFSHLMKKLNSEGNNPTDVYYRRLSEYRKTHSMHAIPG